jgi:hypothetical protein
MPKTEQDLSINLSAIVYQEAGIWIAHCLELDLVAEGKDPDDALEALISLCDLQITVALNEGDLESVFKPAPPEFWKMFSKGRQKLLAEKGRPEAHPRFEAPVERFEARELAFA